MGRRVKLNLILVVLGFEHCLANEYNTSKESWQFSKRRILYLPQKKDKYTYGKCFCMFSRKQKRSKVRIAHNCVWPPYYGETLSVDDQQIVFRHAVCFSFVNFVFYHLNPKLFQFNPNDSHANPFPNFPETRTGDALLMLNCVLWHHFMNESHMDQ